MLSSAQVQAAGGLTQERDRFPNTPQKIMKTRMTAPTHHKKGILPSRGGGNSYSRASQPLCFFKCAAAGRRRIRRTAGKSFTPRGTRTHTFVLSTVVLGLWKGRLLLSPRSRNAKSCRLLCVTLCVSDSGRKRGGNTQVLVYPFGWFAVERTKVAVPLHHLLQLLPDFCNRSNQITPNQSS